MSSQTVFLIDMPDLVMRNIMDYCDFYDIMKLRKTCRSFRNLIIPSTSNKSIISLRVNISSNSVLIRLRFRDLESMTLNYHRSYGVCLLTMEERHAGCFDSWNKKEFWMRNIDFITAFSMDLTAFLESTRSLQNFTVSVRSSPTKAVKPEDYEPDFMEFIKIGIKRLLCSRRKNHENELLENTIPVFNLLEAILKRRRRPLRVKVLYFEIRNPNDVMKILPYIDSKGLEVISIIGRYFRLWEMNGIMETPVFKNLKTFVIDGLFINIPLTSFLHMNYCRVHYKQFPEEDVITILKIMKTSEVKTTFDITQEKRNDSYENCELIKKLGSIYPEVSEVHEYHLHIPYHAYPRVHICRLSSYPLSTRSLSFEIT